MVAIKSALSLFLASSVAAHEVMHIADKWYHNDNNQGWRDPNSAYGYHQKKDCPEFNYLPAFEDSFCYDYIVTTNDFNPTNAFGMGPAMKKICDDPLCNKLYDANAEYWMGQLENCIWNSETATGLDNVVNYNAQPQANIFMGCAKDPFFGYCSALQYHPDPSKACFFYKTCCYGEFLARYPQYYDEDLIAAAEKACPGALAASKKGCAPTPLYGH